MSNIEHPPGNGHDPKEMLSIVWRYYDDLRLLGRTALDQSGYLSESINSGILAEEFVNKLTSEWRLTGHLKFDIHSRKQFLTVAATEMRCILKARHQRRAGLPSEPATPSDTQSLTRREIRKYIRCDCSSAAEFKTMDLVEHAWSKFAAAEPESAWLLEQRAILQTSVPELAEILDRSETALYRRIEKADQTLRTHFC